MAKKTVTDLDKEVPTTQVTPAGKVTIPAKDVPSSKFPRLEEMYKELKDKKVPLAKEREEVRARLDELTQSEEINQLRNRMKELNKELGPIDNELAALARAIGPKASIAVEQGIYEKGE